MRTLRSSRRRPMRSSFRKLANVKLSGPRASGSKSKTKRKLPKSQVAETVKKLLKHSDAIQLDVDTPSDIEFQSDSEQSQSLTV